MDNIQDLYDILRVATMLMGLITLGMCVATWAKPMPFSRRIRFYTLGALVAATAVSDYERLGFPPVLPWRLFADTILVAFALAGCVGMSGELPHDDADSPDSRL